MKIVDLGNGTGSVEDVLSLGGIRFFKVGVKWGVVNFMYDWVTKTSIN